MKRLMILGSVVLAGMVTANCANSREGASSASIMAPSAIDSSAIVDTMARGGGGGKKPGGGGTTGGSGTFTLAMVTDANGNGLANWNDTVTWTISTTATTEPNVSLTCSQNGVLVYTASAGYYAGYPWPWNQNMTLRSTAWSGGAANCVAKLYYFVGTSTIDLGSQTLTVAQ